MHAVEARRGEVVHTFDVLLNAVRSAALGDDPHGHAGRGDEACAQEVPGLAPVHFQRPKEILHVEGLDAVRARAEGQRQVEQAPQGV